MTGEALRLLVRLDGMRLRGSAKSPSLGRTAGWLIPLGLAVALLWAVGRAGSLSIGGAEDAVLLGMLVAGPVSYLAYGTLFRSADAPFLRRLGVPPRALYAERAGRHLVQAMGIGLLGVVPFAAAGSTVLPAAAAGLAAALGAWGAGALATAGAGLAMARKRPGDGWGWAMAGIRDREVAAAAPLAYAPVPGFLAGVLAAGAAGHDARWLLVMAPAAVALAVAGADRYERALPRFGARALELAFSPATDARSGELRVGRGIAAALPRRARVAQARDAVVVGRRFPWAVRMAWPVAIGGFLALARWGEDPTTRAWVVGGVLLVLLAQALASVGLGRAEAAGSRWLDRSVGIGRGARFAGRWAWGWGLSLWMTVPVALAWAWWSGIGGAWGWPLAGGVIAGVGALGSVMAAGWR